MAGKKHSTANGQMELFTAAMFAQTGNSAQITQKLSGAVRQKRCRERRKSRGLCPNCGKFPPLLGHTRCEKCRTRHNRDDRTRSTTILEATGTHPVTTRHRAARLEAIAHYGGKCAACDITHPAFLTFDHVNDDGARHRKTERGAKTHIFIWLKRNGYPSGFQLLCWNHNWLKFLEKSAATNSTTAKSAKSREKDQRLRTSVLAVYGDACACCSLDDQRLLAIDHIHGGGADDRRFFKSAKNMWRSLRDNPRDDIQVLCRNCNAAKAYTPEGACPHRLS